MADIMLNRMIAVTIGAVLIAAGTFAITDPGAVRSRLSMLLHQQVTHLTESQLMLGGALLVMLASVCVVGALAIPAGTVR